MSRSGDPISVRASKLRQLVHLAIPANEAINLAAVRGDRYRRVRRRCFDVIEGELHDVERMQATLETASPQ